MIEPVAEQNGTVDEHDASSLAALFTQLRAGTLPEEDKPAARERIRQEGIPPRGTPERAAYMRLYKGESGPNTRKRKPQVARNQEPVRRGRRPARVLTLDEVAEVIRLYQDPAMPVGEIRSAYSLTDNRLYRILREHGVPQRYNKAAALPVAAPRLDRAVLVSLAAPVASQERQWTVSFSVMVTRTVTVAAASVDEALRTIRAEHGEDIDVAQVQRA